MLQAGKPAILRSAVALYEKGDYAGAAHSLRPQVRFSHWVVAYLLARSCLDANDPGGAEEILEKYLTAQFRLPSVALLRLETQSQMAARSYNAVLAKAPESNQARLLQAKSLAAENHVDAAIEQYRVILSTEPDLAQVHLAIGELYLDQSRWASAAEEFVQELRISPENSLALALLGHAYTEEDQPDRAIPVLEKVLVRFPKDAKTLGDYGKALAQKGETDRAIAVFERALKADSSQYRIHYRLFQLYRSTGQDELARRHLSMFQAEEAKEAWRQLR